MKALLIAAVLLTTTLAHGKVTCDLATAGFENGSAKLTKTPLRVFAESDRVNSLFLKEGDFYAEYTMVPELGVEQLSITYKSAGFLRTQADATFNSKGIAKLELSGDLKVRPNATLTCEKK